MKKLIGICELVDILQNAINVRKEQGFSHSSSNESIKFAYEYDEVTETYTVKLTKEFVDDVINIRELK